MGLFVTGTDTCLTIAAVNIGSPETDYGSFKLRSLAVRALQEELLIRPLGNALYFMPPYCIEGSVLSASWEKIGLLLNEIVCG